MGNNRNRQRYTLEGMSMRRKIIALCIIIAASAVIITDNMVDVESEKPVYEYIVSESAGNEASSNMVTDVYLNYRYYDTLFETLMLMYSVIGVIYLSIHIRGEQDE